MVIEDMSRLEDKATAIAGQLRALGHDARLLVLCHLVKHGEVAAGALTGIGGLSQSALSQHLKRMRDDGLVACRRDGRNLFYRIADPRTEELMAALYRLYCETPS